MDPEHKRRLTGNRVELVSRIVTSPVLMSHFISRNILKDYMVEEINNEMVNPSRRLKAGALLNRLPMSGPDAYRTLVEGLLESEQGDIADFLDQDLANFCRRASGLTGAVGHECIEVGAGEAVRPYDHIEGPVPQIDDESPILKFTILNAVDVDRFPLPRYSMSSRPRGKSVIVNIEEFLPKAKQLRRVGSSVDVENLKNLCEQLGFTVEVWSNLIKQDIIDRIECERQAAHHKMSDAFMMFILSHGVAGDFFAADGERVNISGEVIHQFNGVNCPALVNKPKMFFVQACQGKNRTWGVVSDGPGSAEADTHKQEVHSDDSRDRFLTRATHEMSDILVALATVQGYESYRHTEMGSWFIRNLVKVFAQNAHKMHVVDMLTHVNNCVDKEDHPLKQVCETRSILPSFIYLLPGHFKE